MIAALFVGLEEHLRVRLGPCLNAGTARDDLAAQAHATVSAANTLGFADVSDLCRMLEVACLSG